MHKHKFSLPPKKDFVNTCPFKKKVKDFLKQCEIQKINVQSVLYFIIQFTTIFWYGFVVTLHLLPSNFHKLILITYFTMLTPFMSIWVTFEFDLVIHLKEFFTTNFLFGITCELKYLYALSKEFEFLINSLVMCYYLCVEVYGFRLFINIRLLLGHAFDVKLKHMY